MSRIIIMLQGLTVDRSKLKKNPTIMRDVYFVND